MADDVSRAVEAVWRIEGARIVGALARMCGDLGLAEDVTQEAVSEALEAWRERGVPQNAGAWLMSVAKRRLIDAWRRRSSLEARYGQMAHELAERGALPHPSDVTWDPIDDDLLRLVFTACHPSLSRESQVALTLRIVGGLTSQEIARMLLVATATVQARITRAKKTLSLAEIPFAAPEPQEWPARLVGVCGVVYLIFTEGYVPTAGDQGTRPDLADEALRLGRVLAELVPHEPEVHALVALMEFQRSRFAARSTQSGEPVLLSEQDRSRWDRAQIARGSAALRRATHLARARGRAHGPYALQASIAECHCRASGVEDTDWGRIVLLYEALCRISPSPVAELGRAVAVSMATGPANALRIVDEVAAEGRLRGSPSLPGVRGELLLRLGRHAEACREFEAAAAVASNEAQRSVFMRKIAELSD